jgi:hypothetical protein
VGQPQLAAGDAPQAATVQEPVYINGVKQPGSPKKFVIVDQATYDGFGKGQTPYTPINDHKISNEASSVVKGNSTPTLNVLTGQATPATHVFNPNQTTSGTTPTGTTPEQAGQQATQANQQTDQEFDAWLNTLELSQDQKNALKAVYEAVSVNDEARAKQVTEAMAAAAEYSEPYFAASAALVSDALARNIGEREGDFEFQSEQLQRSLQALKDNVAASKDYLSFQNRQELEGLARKYEGDIEQTQNAMAATGFTRSTRRQRTEQLLTDVHGSAVESSNRALSYQTGQLNRQLGTTEQDTQAQLANLQRQLQEGNVAALRNAEQTLGTSALQDQGYTGLLGTQGTPIGGELERQRVADSLSFANSTLIF